MTSAEGAATLLNLNWERFALHLQLRLIWTARTLCREFSVHHVFVNTCRTAMLLNRQWDPLRAPRSERASRACYSGPLPCCNNISCYTNTSCYIVTSCYNNGCYSHLQSCIPMLLNRQWDPLRAPQNERASRAVIVACKSW